jgi:hypothetical protein
MKLPASAGRGIKAELRRSLTRLRSDELATSSRLRRDKSARFTLPSSVGLKPLAKTDHPCSPPKNCDEQSIQAKANKSLQKENWKSILFKKNRSICITSRHYIQLYINKKVLESLFFFYFFSHRYLRFPIADLACLNITRYSVCNFSKHQIG